jgi:hypothetical protein
VVAGGEEEAVGLEAGDMAANGELEEVGSYALALGERVRVRVSDGYGGGGKSLPWAAAAAQKVPAKSIAHTRSASRPPLRQKLAAKWFKSFWVGKKLLDFISSPFYQIILDFDYLATAR